MKAKKNAKADLEKSRSVFFLIGIVVALAVVLVAFNSATETSPVDDIVFNRPDEAEEDITPITREPEKQEVKPPQPIQPIELKIVDDDDEVLDDIEIEGPEVGVNDIIPPKIETIKKKIEIEDVPVNFASKMPQFPGGEIGLRKYIAKHVVYPHSARQAEIEGKVYIRFCVTSKGMVNKVQVARGVDPIIDNEAIKVIKMLPKWTPGEHNGRKVSVWYTVPINFQINK